MDWEELFSSVKALVLPKLGLDHSPLLLQRGDTSFGPRPFCFQLMWYFKELVAKWWNYFVVEGPRDKYSV